jgi:argininosuccinate lyase
MLVKTGSLTPGEGKALTDALTGLKGKITAIPPEMEDVHMVVEDEVTRRVGEEVGGKLHTGKSRNDQVATALRMRLRSFIIDICEAVIGLQGTILERASENLSVVMPGFTHLQHAQPITVGHYFMAYFDMFGRSLERLLGCYTRVNLSPMGAAALAGTGYPIDRELVANYLGFDGLLENTLDAVASRDFCLEAVSVLSIMMADLSRIAEEFVIWSSYEFSYIEMPDDHSSTSSIMPQKKNPVTSEMMRAKSGDVFGELASMIMIMKGLPLTYNLDMQEVTPHMWRACEASLLSLRVMSDLIRKVKFREERLKSVVQTGFSVATEVADVLVREGRLPFRKAHHVVGSMVRNLCASSSSLSEVDSQRLSDMVFERAGVRLSTSSIQKATDPLMNVNIRKTQGGPAISEVKRMLAVRKKSLVRSTAALSSIQKSVEDCKKIMYSELSAL